jgi:hypothetical protein
MRLRPSPFKGSETFALKGPRVCRLKPLCGPLNAAAIEALLDPPIARRRLNDALSRLIQRGIVVKRFQNLFQTSHDQYYQLSARKECQAEIGDVIGMDPNIFRIPRVRNQDLYHSIGCAHLAESLRKNFPMAEVVREFHLLEHPVGKTTHLSSLEGENQILPDMLLTFPEDEEHREVNIAFEFERSKKAMQRLGRKMYRYASWTRVHGVVWMCEESTIQRDLCKSWNRQKERVPSLSRIRFDHFHLFTTNPKVFHSEDRMFNAKGDAIRLSHWIDVNRSKLNHPVTDEHFRATSEAPAHLG